MTIEENNTNNQTTENHSNQLEDIEKKIKIQEEVVVSMEAALVEAMEVLSKLKKDKTDLEEQKRLLEEQNQTLQEEKQRLLNEKQDLENSNATTGANVKKVANSLNSLEARIVQLNNRFKEFNK